MQICDGQVMSANFPVGFLIPVSSPDTVTWFSPVLTLCTEQVSGLTPAAFTWFLATPAKKGWMERYPGRENNFLCKQLLDHLEPSASYARKMYYSCIISLMHSMVYATLGYSVNIYIFMLINTWSRVKSFKWRSLKPSCAKTIFLFMSSLGILESSLFFSRESESLWYRRMWPLKF